MTKETEGGMFSQPIEILLPDNYQFDSNALLKDLKKKRKREKVKEKPPKVLHNSFQQMTRLYNSRWAVLLISFHDSIGRRN